MRIVVNENIPQRMVTRLGELGYEVVDLKKVSPRVEDSQVASEVQAKGGVVLTRDKDYLALNEKYPNMRLVLMKFLDAERRKESDLVDFLHAGKYLTGEKRWVEVYWKGESVSIRMSDG